MLTNSDARGASVTSEGRQRGWVLIAVTWGSRFGDPWWRLGQRPGGTKTDGDAAGGSGGGDDADSERDPTTMDLRLMAFETD